MFNLNKITRKNILNLKPYSSARNEYEDTDAVLLDANESPYNRPYNRYPDPLQKQLKTKIAELLNKKYSSINTEQRTTISYQHIFLGNGSDEAIDLLMRAFCEPGIDNIISMDPSYGMYEVCADINNISFRKVMLNADFSLNTEAILSSIDSNTKLIFLCSPNNPTANSFNKTDILKIVESFEGIVVIDEAYIDFSGQKSFIEKIFKYPNIVILQTFSKSKAMAGIRLGMAIALPDIIDILNRIKYPYNVNILTQNFALESIDSNEDNAEWINEILDERKKMINELSRLSFIEKIYPSDANFLLVKVVNHKDVFDYLIRNKIVVRDRSKQNLCDRCLRITIGNKSDNTALINALKNYKIK